MEVPLYRRDGSVAAVALVSACDYDALMSYRWHRGRSGYAVRSYPHGDGRPGLMPMHRQILGLARGDAMECDHINRTRLDNRRENLRLVTHAQNQQNKSASRGSSSRHRGVYWDSRDQLWVARIKSFGRTLCSARFRDETAAGQWASAMRVRLFPFSAEAA